LLLKEIFPVAEPLAWGANFTLNEILCPAGSVKGSDNPFTLNSELVEVADETVTFELPAANATLKLLLLPTGTLPKLKVAGLIVSFPAAIPLADNGIVSVAPEIEQRIETLPVALPADFALKLA